MNQASTRDIPELMRDIGEKAKAAAGALAVASTESKDKALTAAAKSLRDNADAVKAANAKDMAAGEAKGLTKALLDRLFLDDGRIHAMADGLDQIAGLPDPVGAVMAEWDRPSGLHIARVRAPLGVIGIIYESRPNVTADAGALCLKAGNAAILRGGSESFHSSAAILECLQDGLRQAKLPETCIQDVPTTDRAAVGEMLTMSDHIDVIVPRGGKGLIQRVTDESKIPLFKHLEGICHTYIDRDADKDMARDVTVNAKMRRTGICGATETLLVHDCVLKTHLPAIIDALDAMGCELRGDARVQPIDPRIKPATEEDWSTEYLDAILSIKAVSDVDEAIAHINKYGSEHTESIITRDAETAEWFLNRVGSAIVAWNASTQYADGGEFGMGAEIGISTGKLHARGPVGVEQLTSFKYQVRGTGQCRP